MLLIAVFSTAIELTSFVVAVLMVCFTFRRKNMLRRVTIELWLSSVAQSQGPFSFSYCPVSECDGVAEEAGRGQKQDSCPKVAREIFSTM